MQGSPDKVLFGFSLTPSASVDFTAVNIATLGSVDDGDLGNFRLVRDTDNSGTFNGGDVIVKTVSTLADPLVFSSFDHAQNGITSAARYLLIADVAADATVGATYTANIASPSDVTTTGEESGSASGNTQTIASSSAPAITTSTATIASFGNVAHESSSSEATFTVIASNLTAGVTVEAPSHFDISTTSGSGFSSTKELSQTGGQLDGQPVTVHVRFRPSGPVGSVTGNLTLTSTGAPTKTIAVSGFAFDSQPSLAPSSLSFTAVTSTGFTINWSRGNGDSVLVVVKAGSAVDADPVDRTVYTANASFGSGSLIGTGNRVVYKGTGTSVAVTGLSAGITYHVEIFEFNAGSAANTQNYQEAGLTGSQAIAVPDPSVVVTKYVNATPDIIELMVIQDGLDMRGMILKDFSSNMGGDGGGTFTFTTNSLWESLRAGTLIVIRNNNSAADLTTSDLSLDLGLTNTTYFTAGGGTFDIATTEMIMIKAAGSGTAGVTGSIHVLAAGTAGSNYTAAAPPKLIASGTTGTGFGVYANVTNGLLSDFNGTDATGNVTAASLTFGTPQTTTLETYRNTIKTYHATTLTGSAGFRSLSSPVANVALSSMFGSIWTQGFTGADATNGGANVFFKQGGGASSFTAATNITNTISAGHGVLVAVFADDDYATAGVQGGFPKTLSVTGTANPGDVAVTTAAWSGGSEWEYFLAGNPYPTTIDWDLVAKGANVDPIAWVVKPDGNTDSWNGSVGDLMNGLIAPFQGFIYAYNGPASGITFTNAAKSTGGSFRGKEAEVFAIRLALRDGTRENSTWLQFAQDGTFGRDKKDAVKFGSLSSNVFQVFTHELETMAEMDIHYLPMISETLELPLGFRSSTSGEFTLAATDIRLPAGWTLALRDNSTGRSHSVNTGSQLVVSSQTVNTSSQPVNFTLIIDPATSTSTENGKQIPENIRLEQNYPNPFNPSTVIRFTPDARRA